MCGLGLMKECSGGRGTSALSSIAVIQCLERHGNVMSSEDEDAMSRIADPAGTSLELAARRTANPTPMPECRGGTSGLKSHGGRNNYLSEVLQQG